MNKFLKKTDLNLVNGGYLVATEGEVPVFNQLFIDAQTKAHSLVLLAEKVKKANFEATKVDSFDALVAEVNTEINKETAVSYVTEPETPKLDLTEKLKKEALSWLKFQESTSTSDKINKNLQEFNVLQEFEDFGLYFTTDKIVKLPKIYAIADLVEAMKVLIKHLD